MKKYVQVILVVLSVFSLVSLLVYRHEYNKLRYVLEVLNFFGTPGGSQANSSCPHNFTFHHYSYRQPPPSWQRVSNSIYVYSAFYDTQDERNVVKAVAIGVLSENLNYGCYIWYEGRDSPVKGSFSFSTIVRKNPRIPSKNTLNSKYFGKTTKNKGFTFYCDSVDSPINPSAVTFYKTNNDETAQAYIPVTIITPTKQGHNSTAICVMPVEKPIRRTDHYLEFLRFHNVVGVKDFYVYGGEYLYNLLHGIHSNLDNAVAVESLQWNYPFITDYDLMRSVAETDCILRSKGFFSVVVPLTWSQYFVPKFHSDISKIIHDFDPGEKVPKFQVPTILFCLEYNDDPKSTPKMPLIFRKSRYALPKSDIPINISRLHVPGSTLQKIGKEIAAVHWYTKCDMFDLKVVDKTEPKFDHSILRFNEELLQSRNIRANSIR